MQDIGRYRGVEMAQRSIVAVEIKRKPRMLAELRVGAAPVKELKGSDAVGIEPCGDDGCLRGTHVVRRIVKKDAALCLREVEQEDEQGYGEGPEEA
jgi:hypothetical protein